MAFLMRCRDSSVIPGFARIKHILNTPRNLGVFLKASLGLVRSEICRVRKNLDRLSRLLLVAHLELSSLFPAPLWTRIDACSALKSQHLEELLKLKQSAKFLKLARRSAPDSGLLSEPHSSSWVSSN